MDELGAADDHVHHNRARRACSLQASAPPEVSMHQFVLDRPKLAFIVATRVALGVGIGLLASLRMPESRRRAVGAALLSVGAATTVPAVFTLLRSRRPADAF
jgi:hypothetical protein